MKFPFSSVYENLYEIKETKTPEGYLLNEEVFVRTVTSSGTGAHDVKYSAPSVKDEPAPPEIRTEAKDLETGTHTAGAGSSGITDTVTYRNLVPGKRYVLTGKLMDRTTGEPFLMDGEEITAEAAFTAEKRDGTMEVIFPLPAGAAEGRALVCFESLSEEGGKAVAAHEDPDDPAQTVFFPSVSTSAEDPASVTGLGTLQEDAVVTDTVAYADHGPGDYVMRGTLADKGTGEAVTDPDGHAVTAEAFFTVAEGEPDGEIVLSFSFDSRNMTGREIVVFERDYLIAGGEEILVASHEDRSDPAQTITYPDPRYEMYKIRNEAASRKAGTDRYGFHRGDVVTYDVVIENTGNVDITTDVTDAFEDGAEEFFTRPVVTDVKNAEVNGMSGDRNRVSITVAAGETAIVTYQAEILPAAEEYLAGAAEDSDSLDADGEPVNREKEANDPDDDDGYVNTARTEEPTYPAPSDPSRPLPVPDGPKDDPAQTPVKDPEIRTVLTDGAGRKVLEPLPGTLLVDTVSYEGLKPGRVYAMAGRLVVKETGRPVTEEGKPFTAVTVFTAEEEEGTVEVLFPVEASAFPGTELVCFEACYDVTELPESDRSVPERVLSDGIPAAEHKDAEDPAQTVRITEPAIGTVLSDSEGRKECTEGGIITLTDTVRYAGLVPGGRYAVVGELYVRETGEPLTCDGMPVKAFTVFTADAGDGEVPVLFVIGTDGLAGKHVVAFETCYTVTGAGEDDIETPEDAELLGTEIAAHKDPEDEDQAVLIVKEPEKTPRTGDGTDLRRILLFGGIFASALGLLAAVILVRKRKETK